MLSFISQKDSNIKFDSILKLNTEQIKDNIFFNPFMFASITDSKIKQNIEFNKRQDTVRKIDYRLDEAVKIKLNQDRDVRRDTALIFDVGSIFASATVQVPAFPNIAKPSPSRVNEPNRRPVNIIPIFNPEPYEPTRPRPPKQLKEIIPEQPTILLPTFDFIGGARDKKKKKKKVKFTKQKYQYTPTVEAIQFNIFGRKPIKKGQTELGFRPMLRM
jgi:hypothetical protein